VHSTPDKSVTAKI